VATDPGPDQIEETPSLLLLKASPDRATVLTIGREQLTG
jgi:hypothetical protein